MLDRFAHSPNDSEDLRLKKISALIIAGACCVAGACWSLMYYFIYGVKDTTILPASFVVIVGTCILISHWTKNYKWAVYALIVCIMYITALIQWSIGGLFDSGFVMAWSIIGPITALTFFSIREAILWFILFFVNIFITVFFDDYLSMRAIPVEGSIIKLYFVMNLGISSLVVFIFASYFVSNIQKERSRADNLLLNILPGPIARRLKNNEKTIADRHENVSVLFADIVGFTNYASRALPEELILKLDLIFNRFDKLAQKYGIEKIKTIGDAYMVAGGIPNPDPAHCEKMAFFAFDMLAEIEALNENAEHPFTVRIGIHCGPVVAGVIGQSKIAYDLWGDTVNVASRMESTGVAGKIQISENFQAQISDAFHTTERGKIEVKGKGQMNTHFLVSKR